MTTVEIELPEATAQAAKAAGLLTPQAIDRLLSNALREQEANSPLPAVAADAATVGIDPETLEEIDAEVKRARAQLRARAPAHARRLGGGGARAWPADFFVNVIGAWHGEPLTRAPQGVAESRTKLD